MGAVEESPSGCHAGNPGPGLVLTRAEINPGPGRPDLCRWMNESKRNKGNESRGGGGRLGPRGARHSHGSSPPRCFLAVSRSQLLTE